jgi:hypothetical protein
MFENLLMHREYRYPRIGPNASHLTGNEPLHCLQALVRTAKKIPTTNFGIETEEAVRTSFSMVPDLSDYFFCTMLLVTGLKKMPGKGNKPPRRIRS